MGGTQDQESYGFLKSLIWRTVSFQALPRKVLSLRNFLIPMAIILVAIDAFDSWHLSYQTKLYKACAAARSNAYKFAADNGYVLDPQTMSKTPPAETMTFMPMNDTTPLVMNMTTGMPMESFTLMAYQLEET